MKPTALPCTSLIFEVGVHRVSGLSSCLNRSTIFLLFFGDPNGPFELGVRDSHDSLNPINNLAVEGLEIRSSTTILGIPSHPDLALKVPSRPKFQSVTCGW